VGDQGLRDGLAKLGAGVCGFGALVDVRGIFGGCMESARTGDRFGMGAGEVAVSGCEGEEVDLKGISEGRSSWSVGHCRLLACCVMA
jgi:hypothetical protein